MLNALDIHVTGIVQGVGFRPFVYRLAKRHLVNGWVLNAVDGVHIHAEGEERLVDEFVLAIHNEAPAAASVKRIDMAEVPLEGFDSFEIRFSDADAAEEATLVSPDLATCDDCLAELFDPSDRRYRYPFVNCTNCGPRFTIIDSLPYDRAATSMAPFAMCEACAREYADVSDRRFHAQPDACFDCGPALCFVDLRGAAAAASGQAEIGRDGGRFLWARNRCESDAIIARAVDMLVKGSIVAVKGLGGFHLVCDASNAETLALLRERKNRPGKAFAVMVADADAARASCVVSDEEEALLKSPARPIVLLRKLPDARFATGLADRLPELGVMLPATPLQHLILHDFQAATGRGMLVFTSGNMHDEPIQTDDEQACAALAGIADALVGNNRPIRARYDDSVARVLDFGVGETAIQFIRRARGYAPQPLRIADLPRAGACGAASARKAVVFATGPEQKNTFCHLEGERAFVSQHVGDMENAATFDAWLESKAGYERLFGLAPAKVACDTHPAYLTSAWAARQELPLVQVQHHHAHIASAMAEHGLDGPVLGFAFDGTGAGPDGAVWGGEVLLARLDAYERFANFAYFPLPGGAASIRHPLRCAYGVLWAFDLLGHPGAAHVIEAMGEQAALCEQMIEQDINTPYTSSVGRLFDAASAILGICTEPSYEGEPAILLEAALPTCGAAKGSGDGCASDAPLVEELDSRFAESNSSSCASLLHALKEPAPQAFRNGVQTDATPSSGPSYAGTGLAELGGGAAAAALGLAEPYAIDIVKNAATESSTALDTSVLLLDPAPAFRALLDDVVAGVRVQEISRRFHDAFVEAIVQVARIGQAAFGIQVVVLTGGVFMNRFLCERAVPALAQAGFTVAMNKDLPPNDGCVSFGQAVVALHRTTDEGAQEACVWQSLPASPK